MTTLGDAYMGAGRPDRAADVFTALIEIEPDAPALFCRLGDARAAAGDYAGAEDAYDGAIAIEPSDAHRFYCALGATFAREGEYERAATALKQSLHSRPDQPLVRCTLGDVLIRQGKPDEGMAAYEEAARLDAASAGGYYNRLGNSLAGEGRHDLAVSAFEKAVAADPRNPFYCLSLVKSCEAEGLHEKAKEAYEKAQSLGVFS
jgi:tetratricopeptide (TPR) repeat protein